MLINSGEFVIDKLLLLFYIAWLLQLKKISNNQIKISENILKEEKQTGLVIIFLNTLLVVSYNKILR